MTDLITLASGFCFIVGGFLCITGGVGLQRFPDFFCRVHAAGVTETLATPLLLTGSVKSEFVGLSVEGEPNPFGFVTASLYAVFDTPGDELAVLGSEVEDCAELVGHHRSQIGVSI